MIEILGGLVMIGSSMGLLATSFRFTPPVRRERMEIPFDRAFPPEEATPPDMLELLGRLA